MSDSNNNNENTGFELSEDEIKTIEKAIFILETMEKFSHWVANNIQNINKEPYDIIEDFVKSNDHIIQRINKYRPSS